MSETKSEVKTVGHSEKFSLKLRNFAMPDISNFFEFFFIFLIFFEISLGFSLKLGISLGTVPSEILHFRFSQNFR